MSNFTPLDTGKNVKFSDLVEKLCSSIKDKKKEAEVDKDAKREYKYLDKWQKLSTQLPQAVFGFMQGIL